MINIRARGERADSSDLTSLIDVVFILLIFFILAASFAVHSIDFDLPPAKTSKALAGHVVEIRLNKDGSFLCDGIPTKKEELDERLASVIIQFKARPGQIVLMADWSRLFVNTEARSFMSLPLRGSKNERTFQ